MATYQYSIEELKALDPVTGISLPWQGASYTLWRGHVIAIHTRFGGTTKYYRLPIEWEEEWDQDGIPESGYMVSHPADRCSELFPVPDWLQSEINAREE